MITQLCSNILGALILLQFVLLEGEAGKIAMGTGSKSKECR